MIATFRENSLLGSYQERDYSKGFQKMMSNVVAKIYRNKGSRQNVFKTLTPHKSQEPSFKRPSVKLHYFQEGNYRKNSTPIASYSMSSPKSNGFNITNQRSKYSLPSFKLPDEYYRTPPKQGKKCYSLPHSYYRQSLYQKISDYNLCLITRTYKFQEKQKLAVCFDDTEQKESSFQESSTFISKIKKLQNFKKNNKWINSRGKFIEKNIIDVSLKEDFQPWQIEHGEQQQY